MTFVFNDEENFRLQDDGTVSPAKRPTTSKEEDQQALRPGL